MPWCDDCSKFWNPPELAKGGACPTCGAHLGAAVAGRAKRPQTRRPPTAAAAADPETGEQGRAAGAGGPAAVPPRAAGATAKAKGAPWHFKLLVVGVTVYMVYRIYWLIEWLPKHL